MLHTLLLMCVCTYGCLQAALRAYEEERSRRCLPLTIRSWVFGTVLQIPFPPVTAARDAFISTAFSPSHFLDHTNYDCGTLPVVSKAATQARGSSSRILA